MTNIKSDKDCQECPLNSAYKFKNKCIIKSCKFYTPSTEHHCMGIDITFSADGKVISDAELLRYKFPDKEITIRDVTKIRKRSVDNTKSNLLLYYLIEAIRTNYVEEDGMPYIKGKSKIIDTVIQQKPFSISLLAFEPWMLKFLADDKFVTSVDSKFKLKDVVRLKNKEYADFTKAIKVLCSGNSLFNNVV